MPIDSRFRQRAEEWVALGMLVVALGGGWYLVDEDSVTDNLDFIEVGWWNIRDLSSANRDDSEISHIAEAIEGMEVLAVGELNEREALDRIAQELGSSWEWDATSEKVGRNPYTAEYYGFLWNSDQVRMVGSVHVDSDPGDQIDREPAWATFETIDENLDFTVIAVHITWGDRVGPRKAEVRLMADVWNRIQQATPGDDDLILVGDFNRNVGDDSFEPLLSLPGVIRANEDTGPTHISSNSRYDQIFLTTDETTEWTGEWGILHFDEIFFADDDSAARLAASDHRPVWITLHVTDQDDD